MNRLESHHNFIRYSKKGNVNENGTVHSAAFTLREIENFLSGNWYEYYENNNYVNILKELRKQNFNFKKNGWLIKLNVGKSTLAVKEKSNIEFINEKSNSSHTGIYNIVKHSGLVIAKLLAESSIEVRKIQEIK